MDNERIEDLIGFGSSKDVAKAISDGQFGIDDIIFLGMTALGVAIYFDNDEVAFMLMENGANVSKCDRDNGGNPPIRIAYEKKNSAIFKALIDRGADINEPGWMGISVADLIAKIAS